MSRIKKPLAIDVVVDICLLILLS